MTLPNFIIGGAPKSGTTSLVYYLREHPDIFMPREEIGFFAKDELYAKGQGWYEEWFASAGSVALVGEKTPGYLFIEQAPERMKELIPKIKLIFLLRHPVERAYSAYWHGIRNKKYSFSFQEAVEMELAGKVWKEGRPFRFVSRGRYRESLERYARIFPREQLLVLRAEDLKTDRAQTLEKVLDFLGAEKILPRNINQEYNLGYSSDKEGAYKAKRLLKKLHLKPMKGGSMYPDMDPGLRKRLEDILEEDISAWKELDYFS